MIKHGQLASFIKILSNESAVSGEPFIINFADANHIGGRAQEVLADPEVHKAMKDSGMNLVVEGPKEVLERIYNELKGKITENPNYSIKDFCNDKMISYESLPSFDRNLTELLLSSAKSGVDLKFPDGMNTEGSDAKIDRKSMEVLQFIQGNSGILSKNNQECTMAIANELVKKVPPDVLSDFVENVAKKRLNPEKASVNDSVVDDANSLIKNNKNAGVLYGAGHFINNKGEIPFFGSGGDIDDKEQAKLKTTILIATDNDLAGMSGLYEQAQQLPKFRYNPDTGKISVFTLEQVEDAKIAAAERQKPEQKPLLTDEQCIALIPKDLKFKNYSPAPVDKSQTAVPAQPLKQPLPKPIAVHSPS